MIVSGGRQSVWRSLDTPKLHARSSLSTRRSQMESGVARSGRQGVCLTGGSWSCRRVVVQPEMHSFNEITT